MSQVSISMHGLLHHKTKHTYYYTCTYTPAHCDKVPLQMKHLTGLHFEPWPSAKNAALQVIFESCNYLLSVALNAILSYAGFVVPFPDLETGLFKVAHWMQNFKKSFMY